jgi:hypothetical protein
MDDGGELHKGKSALHVAFLILLGLLISLPILRHGFPDLSNDGPNHAAWADDFARQLWSGEWYPRWLTDMNGGLGSPDFFFYPPMHVFVSALFRPLMAARDPHGYWISGYSGVLATVLSGLTAYAWIRTLTTARAAVIGAAAYMIAPYHVAIDLYNRGAAAEYWLFVWLPLVMLSSQGIVRNVPYSTVWLAVTYALCAFSHGTVAAVFAVVPITYVVLFSQPGSRIRQIVRAGTGLAAGIGIAAVYLLPAMLDRNRTYLVDQTSNWGDYRNWWLFQVRNSITEAGTKGAGFPWYLSYKMRVLVITLWMVFFCIATYFMVRRRSTDSRVRHHASFYLGLTLVSFFLMLESSDFVWRAIPVLRLIQISHRLDTMVVMSVAVLTALACAGIAKTRARASVTIIALSILGWFVADMVAARQGYAAWRHIPADRATNLAIMDEKRMEYYILWPIQAPAVALQAPLDFARFVSQHPPKTAAFTGDAPGEVRVVNWRPRHFELDVHSPVPGHIVVNHFYYGGWGALDEQTGAVIPLTPAQGGVMDLAVPQGAYRVAVDLPPDAPERAGRILSLLSLIFCGGLVLWERWALRRPGGARPAPLTQIGAQSYLS